MIEGNPPHPKTSQRICGISGCVLPLALLIAAPAGIVLQILLARLVVAQAFAFACMFANSPTHPLIPTWITESLINRLGETPSAAANST